jgi:Holliday junction resolvasome RuvABC endonuclease subunit
LDALKVELADLGELGFDVGLTGFGDDELADLMAEKTEGLTDPDDVPEPPADPVSVEAAMPVLSLNDQTANRDGAASSPANDRPMSVLALDLGTTTGWAVRLVDGSIVSGTMAFRPGRYEGGGMRYLRFRSWLDEFVHKMHKLDAVYFEEVRRHAGTDAAHIYGGFLAHLAAWCEQKGLPYQGVPVGAIKRHVTGKGNADKQAVITAVTARGFAPADDNEADAIAILLWAAETRGGVR